MKVLLFANTDWYLYNFRRSLAEAIRSSGHDVLLVSPEGDYGEELLRQGFRWVRAPMNRRSLHPLRELYLLVWLVRTMREEAVDVVHGFTIKNAIYGSLAARFASVPARVSAVTGLGYVFISEERGARFLRRLLGPLFRLSLSGENARLILQNPEDARMFDAAGLVDAAKIRMIYGSGVDCDRFTPARDRESGDTFRVVLPARLLWDKGLKEYAEAARLLRSQGAAVEFLLAGTPDPGNPASVPEKVLQGWEDEGLVRRLGHVDDMPGLFANVDAVVLPSYREGLPKGLIEAAACGLPLVATDVPGCRDVVSHEEDGLLVPVRESAALAAAIQRLHGDRNLRARLGAAARTKALRLFNEKLIIQQTLAVYDELLGPTAAGVSRDAVTAQGAAA